MPWHNFEFALAGVGAAFVTGAVVAFKQRATTPFKLAYFFAWPTAGSAIILLLSPEREDVEKKMREKGTIDDNVMKEMQQMRKSQMEVLMAAAKNE
mmetsp:Transcript_28648/g.39568  ORF Transcript_28648/g.39568 Transcript_28648/m.39568 type:complete len:96 (+) Transcript_28648:288-575(+)|eukprot:CAMPEP_0196579140 /NCGR_PEP_ID=MMETSP1081-20130531/17671_1 /TAXON_ID=36882 /ORGANISM="Pyramimonas amylifera, Strain CCMP720" /LENGTH=95 /DNA_ID=CAMNT_0041898611 /DNA_START=285 /DNA_END=572 /DNA_ORIENTATION=+